MFGNLFGKKRVETVRARKGDQFGSIVETFEFRGVYASIWANPVQGGFTYRVSLSAKRITASGKVWYDKSIGLEDLPKAMRLLQACERWVIFNQDRLHFRK